MMPSGRVTGLQRASDKMWLLNLCSVSFSESDMTGTISISHLCINMEPEQCCIRYSEIHHKD